MELQFELFDRVMWISLTQPRGGTVVDVHPDGAVRILVDSGGSNIPKWSTVFFPNEFGKSLVKLNEKAT